MYVAMQSHFENDVEMKRQAEFQIILQNAVQFYCKWEKSD